MFLYELDVENRCVSYQLIHQYTNWLITMWVTVVDSHPKIPFYFINNCKFHNDTMINHENTMVY